MGSYTPGIGLILGLGIDPSGMKPGLDQAKGSLAEYEKALDDATRNVNAGFDQTEKAIVSNSQSVRLLAQDLGIGLPRAVSSAVAKMLPDIGQLGGALIGVWAVEKIYGWAKAARDEFGDAATVIGQDIKDLDTAASEAFKHAGAEAAAMLTHFKTSLAGTFDIAQIDARAAQLQRYHDAYKQWQDSATANTLGFTRMTREAMDTIVAAKKEGLNSLKDVDQKINEIGQLQFDAHKHMAEVITKENKDSAEAAKRAGDAAYHAAMQKYEANQKAFHASEEALKHEMALQDQLGRKAVEEAVREEKAREHTALAIRRLTEELRRQHEQEARNAEHLAKEAAREIADVSRIRSDQERQMLRGHAEARQRIEEQHREAVASIQAKNQEAQAIAALAYGTASVEPVAKIVGPGNAYVAAAKRRVFGVVGIDMIAGPSEVVLLADSSADPRFVAADLLAQAEHDEAAQSILITDDAGGTILVKKESTDLNDPLDSNASAPQVFEVSRIVKGFQLQFFNGTDWTDGWDAGVTGALPTQVRVTIDVANTRGHEKRFVAEETIQSTL
ncbi:MAG: histidinol dehydrogenase [Syntrophorhabdales bacterium]